MKRWRDENHPFQLRSTRSMIGESKFEREGAEGISSGSREILVGREW